ncbi:nucleocapsid protein [Wuhan horsefly Virus]|uniref:Nucleoprotein n=1 Tax=Wuhan horsefly Virus TaxID=1608139 RepID=A0A0B5KU60_9VIRU|nr:nucleocapsid protein [Wuhan horsefly Virus]AJG39322.1 nucleocapsid protein [Wuhan horsefly Virus]
MEALKQTIQQNFSIVASAVFYVHQGEEKSQYLNASHLTVIKHKDFIHVVDGKITELTETKRNESYYVKTSYLEELIKKYGPGDKALDMMSSEEKASFFRSGKKSVSSKKLVRVVTSAIMEPENGESSSSTIPEVSSRDGQERSVILSDNESVTTDTITQEDIWNFLQVQEGILEQLRSRDFLDFLKEAQYQGFNSQHIFNKMVRNAMAGGFEVEQFNFHVSKMIGICLLRGPKLKSILKKSNDKTKAFLSEMQTLYGLNDSTRELDSVTLSRVTSTFPYVSHRVHLELMVNKMARYVIAEVDENLAPIFHQSVPALLDLTSTNMVYKIIFVMFSIYQAKLTLILNPRVTSMAQATEVNGNYILAAAKGVSLDKQAKIKFLQDLVDIGFLNDEQHFSKRTTRAGADWLNEGRNLKYPGLSKAEIDYIFDVFPRDLSHNHENERTLESWRQSSNN